MPKTSEKSLQREVLKYLKGQPGVWAVRYTPGPFSPDGVPDILCCVRGRFLAIELKAPGKYKDPLKSQSAAQKKTRKAILDVGGRSIVTDSLTEVKWAVHVLQEPVYIVDEDNLVTTIQPEEVA